MVSSWKSTPKSDWLKPLLDTNYGILLQADIKRESKEIFFFLAHVTENSKDNTSLHFTISISSDQTVIISTWSFSGHPAACLPCDSHSYILAANF